MKTTIPTKLREEMATDSQYQYCMRQAIFKDHGGMLDKRKNEYIALIRATKDDLKEFSKADFAQRLKYLKSKYEQNLNIDR